MNVERSPEPPSAGQVSPEKRTPRVGLALSAGGARGLAHVGVIQVLEENQIEIAAVAGASMGAYVAALWCCGYTGAQLEELAAEMHHPSILRQLADPIIPPMKGLLHGHRAKEHLRKSIGDHRFEDSGRELLIITADVDTRERIVCREGTILDAVHASCAMPGIIAPVDYHERRCVDGGVVDPVPVGALHKFAHVDKVIAVTTIPTFEDIERWAKHPVEPVHKPLWRRCLGSLNRSVNLLAEGNVIDTLRRCLRAAQVRMAHDSCLRADLVLRPVALNTNWFDYHLFTHFIELGRKAATDALPEIFELIQPRPLAESHEQQTTDMVGKRLC